MITLEQAEARALELYPDTSETTEIDENWQLRAAYLACWRDMQSTPPAERGHYSLQQMKQAWNEGKMSFSYETGSDDEWPEGEKPFKSFGDYIKTVSTPASVPAPDRQGDFEGKEFHACSRCDGHPACEDFGCFHQLAAPASPVTADEREAQQMQILELFREFTEYVRRNSRVSRDGVNYYGDTFAWVRDKFMRSTFPAQSPKVLPTREEANYTNQGFTVFDIADAFWKSWGRKPNGSSVIESLLKHLPESPIKPPGQRSGD